MSEELEKALAGDKEAVATLSSETTSDSPLPVDIDLNSGDDVEPPNPQPDENAKNVMNVPDIESSPEEEESPKHDASTQEEKQATVDSEETESFEKIPDVTESVTHSKSNQSTTLGAIRGFVAEAKLLTKQWTGQIEESMDDPQILDAFQKLDAYNEQVRNLLLASNNWTNAMAQASRCQQQLISQLQESHNIINTLREKQPSADDANTEEKKDATNLEQVPESVEVPPATEAPQTTEVQEAVSEERTGSADDMDSDNDTQENTFANLCQRISVNLEKDQGQLTSRHRNSEKYLVEPLRNILNREIHHAIDIRGKYLKVKRQADDLATSIAKLEQQIQDASKAENDEPKPQPSKLRVSLSKLFRTSDSKSDLELKLTAAKRKHAITMEMFETSKVRLLECISVIEHKLNMETEYYFQQFEEYVEQSTSLQQMERL